VRSIKKERAAPPPPATTTPHFDFEREAFACGHRWVAGVDEVGRGPLAGPVGVAAVILDPDDLPFGVDDSKALPKPSAWSYARSSLPKR
jgi:ribonuclease HIII